MAKNVITNAQLLSAHQLTKLAELFEDKAVQDNLKACYDEVVQAASSNMDFNLVAFEYQIKKMGVKKFYKNFIKTQKDKPIKNAWLMNAVIYVYFFK